MSDNFAFWSLLGVKVPPLFSGLAGGVVGAWVDGKSGIRAWLGYAACGALTGAYLGEWAAHFIPFGDDLSAGFFVGACFMFLLRFARGWLNKLDVLKPAGGSNGTEGK